MCAEMWAATQHSLRRVEKEWSNSNCPPIKRTLRRLRVTKEEPRRNHRGFAKFAAELAKGDFCSLTRGRFAKAYRTRPPDQPR